MENNSTTTVPTQTTSKSAQSRSRSGQGHWFSVRKRKETGGYRIFYASFIKKMTTDQVLTPGQDSEKRITCGIRSAPDKQHGQRKNMLSCATVECPVPFAEEGESIAETAVDWCSQSHECPAASLPNMRMCYHMYTYQRNVWRNYSERVA